MALPAPLTALIQSEQLSNVLCVDVAPGTTEGKPSCSLHHVTADQLMEPTFQDRFDLVWLSEATLKQGQQCQNGLIAKCRDQLAARVLLELGNEDRSGLSDTECLALGFVRCATTDRHNYYLFNLKTYKPVPDWLNPRFWANPQNWDKFRW